MWTCKARPIWFGRMILGRLLPARILRPLVRDPGVLHVARMNDYPVPVSQTLPRLEYHSAVLRLVIGEHREPERIRREQAVIARVPPDRMPRILGMIQYRDADLLLADLPGVVAPRRRLAP